MFHIVKSLNKIIKPSMAFAKVGVKRFPKRMISYCFSTTPKDHNNPELDKLKQDSRSFYENQVQRVHEFQNISEWQTLIEQAEEPVVLDLYATWCGPCKQLTPLLQKEAEKDGNWKLIKIDIDKFPEIASQLKIKTVPTVIFIANRQFVDAFSGFPDDTTLKRFLGNLKSSLDSGFLENTKKQNQYMMKLQKARELLINRDYQSSETLIKQILPHIDASLQPLSKLMYAHALIEQNKLQKYEEAIGLFKTEYQKLVDSKDQQFKFITDYLNELDVIYQQMKSIPLQNQVIIKLQEALKSDPSDKNTKFQLANQYINSQLSEQGLILLLDIVKADKNWEGKKANSLILQVFKKLGNSNDLTIKYRKLYQRLLY